MAIDQWWRAAPRTGRGQCRACCSAEFGTFAEAYITQLDQAHVFKAPIVTKLEAFKGFYPAEDYHQDFLVTHPTYPYIVINDQPKVVNLKRLFADQYRDTPVTVMASNRPSQ